MLRKEKEVELALAELKLETEARRTKAATSHGSRRRKESIVYPNGSPHRIHALHKKDGVVKLIEGWSARVGAVCPYIAPSAVPALIAYTYDPASPKKPSSPLKSHTKPMNDVKLPSPKKAAWDSSTSTNRPEVHCNLHIILHNHTLAMTHSHEKLPLAPKYLSKIVIPLNTPLYGLRIENETEKASHKTPIQADTSKEWMLQVHPLHGLNLIDPCRKRKAHICNRKLHPFVEVSIDHKKQTCKPSFNVGPSPVWSNGWLTFPIVSSSDPMPNEFHVRVLNKCGDTDLLVGSTSVSIAFVHGNQNCDFFTLRDRRGRATGQIKVIYHLQPEEKKEKETTSAASQLEAAIAPRAKLLFGNELKNMKNNLRHVEMSNLVIVKSVPIYSREETNAVLREIETNVKHSPTLNLWNEYLVDGKQVGEGIHAAVKMVELNGIVLAAKEFRYEIQDEGPPHLVALAFQKEFNLLNLVHHDNIIQLIGVAIAPRLILITEYMENGSLYQCLQSKHIWQSVTLEQKGYIALQIACALAYLHQQNILHRDLKSHNILLSGLGTARGIPTAKICDLGSALVWTDTNTKPVEEIGTSGYMAPEVASGQGYSFPSDIWSFGIVLWELLTTPASKNPFTGLSSDVFVDQVTQGSRPDLVNCGPYSSLLAECWRQIPSERPSAEEIIAEITRQLK